MMVGKIDAIPYSDRPTCSLGEIAIGNWKMKRYEISREGIPLEQRVIDAAMDHVAANARWPRDAGYGFLTLHKGEEALWLLVDMWADDILHHDLYAAPLDAPERFSAGTNDATMACAWELVVIGHERDAWVRHVLCHPEQPKYDRYMSELVTIGEAINR